MNGGFGLEIAKGVDGGGFEECGFLFGWCGGFGLEIAKGVDGGRFEECGFLFGWCGGGSGLEIA